MNPTQIATILLAVMDEYADGRMSTEAVIKVYFSIKDQAREVGILDAVEKEYARITWERNRAVA
jgi:hypothetical protein